MPFFDTNVLLYSISTNPADAAKRELAMALLSREDGALSVQVLQEFYVQATRVTRPQPLPHAAAVDLITAWRRFRVQEINLSILSAALKSGPHTTSPTGTAQSSRQPARLAAANSIPKI